MQLTVKLKWHFLIFVIMITRLVSAEPGADDNNLFDSIGKIDTMQINLQDAILLALENNPTVTIQRLAPKIAKTYVSEQGGLFDPRITLSANKSETKLQRFLGSRPNPFELVTHRSQYDLALSEILPTGTTVATNASMSSTLSSIYTDQYSGILGLTITQALLQGSGIGYNLANLRQARVEVEISQIELKAIAEEVTASIEQAYWQLYLSNQEIDIQNKSLELAEKQLQESTERVAVGKLSELELAAVHAEVATVKEALIDAKSRYEQARLQFLFLLNPAEEHPWSMIPILIDKPFVPFDTLDSIDNHEQLGMTYRPDLQQARLNYKKNELDIIRTRNGLLPRLDLFINLSRTTYAQSLRASVPDPHSPFYDVSVGITFDFPVPNQQARARLARTKYSREQLALALKNMERLVQWDVRSAYIEVLRSRQQINATQVARALQEKKLQAELEKFRVGKSTNFLVLQAQRDFTASSLNEARAMVSYLEALVNLYLMEGTLLERRGIDSFTT